MVRPYRRRGDAVTSIGICGQYFNRLQETEHGGHFDGVENLSITDVNAHTNALKQARSMSCTVSTAKPLHLPVRMKGLQLVNGRAGHRRILLGSR